MAKRISDRVKMLVVPEDAVMRCLLQSSFGDCVRVLKIEGVPEDARVYAVSYSPEYRGFLFALEHESFNEVPPGMMIPRCEPRPWERQDTIVDLSEHMDGTSRRVIAAAQAEASRWQQKFEEMCAERDRIAAELAVASDMLLRSQKAHMEG